MKQIRIKLKCFSHIKAALGVSMQDLALARHAKAVDVEDYVRNRLGGLSDIPLRIAVNQKIVDREHPLADGDEVALLPPVQGG